MARKIWEQMDLHFLYEKIAESMWRAMERVCDEKTNALIGSLTESEKVEEYDMVAIPTYKNDERRSRKSHKMEAQVGVT